VFRTEQQNASYSDNILSHGRVPVSDQSNLERYVLHIRLPMGESIREVEEYQVQLLNVSVLELLTKYRWRGRARDAEESPFVLIVV